MDELVKLVSQKTGIPEGTARQAVEVVLNFLKDKLPGPIAAQVDNVIKGGGAGLGKGLGGILGG
jgi:uncharacterized protein (DUF2267 family)